MGRHILISRNAFSQVPNELDLEAGGLGETPSSCIYSLSASQLSHPMGDVSTQLFLCRLDSQRCVLAVVCSMCTQGLNFDSSSLCTRVPLVCYTSLPSPPKSRTHLPRLKLWCLFFISQWESQNGKRIIKENIQKAFPVGTSVYIM